MSILFSDIYAKAIALFDDPKITVAYETNKIQFCKLMYSFLQNAIAMFTNPTYIGVKLSSYNVPVGTMEVFSPDEGTVNEDGIVFSLSDDFKILDGSLYNHIENQIMVDGKLDKDGRTITFPDVLPEGQQYAFEQYYVGEFTEKFSGFSSRTATGDSLVVGEIKDILARLLVKAWAEDERNLLLDIRNIMQDSDFKLNGNDRVLRAKNQWVDQLNTEILQLQNKLAWNIRFMSGSVVSPGIGRG